MKKKKKKKKMKKMKKMKKKKKLYKIIKKKQKRFLFKFFRPKVFFQAFLTWFGFSVIFCYFFIKNRLKMSPSSKLRHPILEKTK